MFEVYNGDTKVASFDTLTAANAYAREWNTKCNLGLAVKW